MLPEKISVSAYAVICDGLCRYLHFLIDFSETMMHARLNTSGLVELVLLYICECCAITYVNVVLLYYRCLYRCLYRPL